MTPNDHLDIGDAATNGGVDTAMGDTVARDGAPEWIGHLVSGVQVSESYAPATDTADRVRFQRVARLVSMHCYEEDRRLEQVRTGRLLRIVAETADGALYCLPMVRDQHLVGVLRADRPDDVGRADRLMIALVDRLRWESGLPGQNPGGLARFYQDQYEGEDATAPMIPGGNAAGSRAFPETGLRSLVGPERAHWVAHVVDRDLAHQDDCFDDPRMSRHFVVTSPQARRRFYTEFALGAAALLHRVGRTVRPVVGGPLDRLVLDVEEGALVAHRITQDQQLVGVTLDQSRVEGVERRLRAAAARMIREAGG